MIKIFALFFLLITLTGCLASNQINTGPVDVRSVPLPGALDDQSGAFTPPKHVALLLPLQGNLASVGQAVRDSYLAAYNNAPLQARPQHIDIIDTTTTNNIQTAYQQAITQGADFIVGPLTKPDVQAISSLGNLPVPTLTLNYLDPNQSVPTQLYQFGLSPLDEARQAAALARQNGSSSALIIAPAGNWGPSVAAAFQEQWLALGGKVSDSLFFTGSSTEIISQQMRNFLHFSQANEHSSFTRRQDFDVIFLAVSPSMARQIRPLLKFYSAGDVPVYATALIYSGTPRPELDSDLNGIIFCDAPWALNDARPQTTLFRRLSLFWPVNFQQNARLYALGVDAYSVSMQLPELASSTQKSIPGASGMLYLNDQHRIARQLECAEFRNGAPQLLG